MTTREICTLQFGHYSNFIGAHWWNLQEFSFSFTPEDHSEINNSVLYREGQTLQGHSTYTPRLLLADLKGSLNSLAEHGELYDIPSSSKSTEIPWHDDLVEVKENDKIAKSEFMKDLDSEPSKIEKKKYNFEDTVKVWSDCLYTRFHPKTINIIREYEHNNHNKGFDVFTQGKELWQTQQFQDDFVDKIRNFAEECNNIQGFHVVLDVNNGFSGLGCDCIEYLHDEYDKKSVLAIPVIPSYYNDYSYETDLEQRRSQINDSLRVINITSSFVDLAEHSSLVVPLCTSKNGWRQPGAKREFNHVLYNDKLMYHTSAILASALDTFTLRYRLRTSYYTLNDLCADLNLHNRKLAAASLCLPFSFNEGADFIECLDNWNGPLSKSITPNCTIGTDQMMQLITLRGIPEDRLKRPSNKAGAQKDMPAYDCKDINEMLMFYMSCTTFGTATNVTNISKGLALKKPYPNFFDDRVGVTGNISAVPRKENESIQSIPILAGLHSCSEISGTIESLHKEAKKLNIERFPQFISTGLEKDAYKECLDKLLDLKECYEDNYVLCGFKALKQRYKAGIRLYSEKIVPLDESTVIGRIVLFMNNKYIEPNTNSKVNCELKTDTKYSTSSVIDKFKSSNANHISNLKSDDIEDLLRTLKYEHYMSKEYHFKRLMKIIDAECCTRLDYLDSTTILRILSLKQLKTSKIDAEDGNVRVKDIRRFLWALSTLGYKDINSDIFSNVIAANMLERIKARQYEKETEELINSVLYMWILNYQPMELIPYALNEANIENVREIKSRTKQRLNLLLMCIFFENKKLFREFNVKAQRCQFQNTEQQLEEPQMAVNKFEISYEIPHLPICGITGYSKKVYKTVFVEVLDDYVCVKNYNNMPSGPMQLKLRILREMDNALITIPGHLVDELSQKDLQEYLKTEIELLC
ncbi:hypothetical protein Trydic_g9419 [Trypoxylus dichotomus]